MLKTFISGAVAAASLLALGAVASAQETVKIGLILPMTGGQASTGQQINNAIKLYQQKNGDTVAGKKVEVILKDVVGGKFFQFVAVECRPVAL